MSWFKSWWRKLIEKWFGRDDDDSQNDPEIPEPDVQDNGTPDKPPINKGGDGLYKPSARLWLLPERNTTNGLRFYASHVGSCGEFRDKQGLNVVRWHKWPGGVGAISGKPVDGGNRADDDANPSHYHNNRVKMRDAKARYSGSWFICRDIYNQIIFTKQIIDKDVRQE